MFHWMVMSQRHIVALFFVTLVVPFVSCTMTDEDRCPKNFKYDPDVSACRLLEDLEDTDVDTDQDTDEDTDDGGIGDASTDDEVTGMGEECFKNGHECDSYDANHCLYDIREPGKPGFCTIKNCTQGDCPDGYQCCNIIISVACMPDDGIEEVIKNGGKCPPS